MVRVLITDVKSVGEPPMVFEYTFGFTPSQLQNVPMTDIAGVARRRV